MTSVRIVAPKVNITLIYYKQQTEQKNIQNHASRQEYKFDEDTSSARWKNVRKKDANGKLEIQITMVNCPISKTNKSIAVENFGDRIFPLLK